MNGWRMCVMGLFEIMGLTLHLWGSKTLGVVEIQVMLKWFCPFFVFWASWSLIAHEFLYLTTQIIFLHPLRIYSLLFAPSLSHPFCVWLMKAVENHKFNVGEGWESQIKDIREYQTEKHKLFLLIPLNFVLLIYKILTMGLM